MKRRLATFAIFFSVLSTLVGSVHYYFFRRLFVAPALGDRVEMLGTILCTALAFLTPAGMLASRMLPRRIGKPIGQVAYVWLGSLWLLLSTLGASELARLALSGRVAEPALSRWIALSVTSLCVIGTGFGLVSALGRVPVRRVPVELRRLPETLSGYRMVQLSDLHIGPTLGRDWVTRLVADVNELDAHAIVITGDLVDGSVARLRSHVAPLADLRARDGVFFVTGNHEYYAGADAWLEELERLGVRALRNERVVVGNGDDTFDLAGVDDWQAFGDGHGPDLGSALAGRDDSRELVLLAHQPRQISEAAERGVGLQLSGHTHGGQIVPWNFFVRFQQPYIAGLIRHGDAQLYVSRGTGFWGPPMRVLAPAEITLLELLPA
jgi:predicted MPP superfamily phosphohydrolase